MKKFSVIALIMLLLVACSGADEPTPLPTETATPTEAAIVEPTPTEDIVAEPTAAPAEDGSDSAPVEEGNDSAETETAITSTFQIEAWADNWFAAYLGEDLIVEDSVSINTERSFNAETATFEASYPLNLNFILKDFKENDTGFIMQLTDMSTGDVVAVSDSSFVCMVIHTAPLDKSCETESNPVAGVAPCTFEDLGEPDGWKSANYDDSAWTATTIQSSSAVGPKDGYNEISWDSSAEFIWGPDLETDNTLLCRVTVSGE